MGVLDWAVHCVITRASYIETLCKFFAQVSD